MVNEVRTNNFGFINDIRYEENATSPLLAIIGDSYVQAFMVPFKDTIAGRLSGYLGDTARAYSFGVAGSALIPGPPRSR